MGTILVGQARKRTYSSDEQAPKKEHPVKEFIMQAKVEKKAPAPKEEEVPVTTDEQEVRETQETAQEAPQEKKEKKEKKGKTQKK